MKNRISVLWVVLTLTLLCRLLTLGTLPLVDPSEGRYATVAQNMVLSGDWITPFTFREGEKIPFLAKPPLQAWLGALSLDLFGMSEFTVRLPSFLASVATLWLLILFAKKYFSEEIGLLAGLIAISSLLFFGFSAICMTDPFLTFATVLAGVSFARFAEHKPTKDIITASSETNARWGRYFFVALGIGMLAKGPVAIVLVGASLGFWILITGRWNLILRLPWISGTALFLLVAAPWYIAAEIKMPGFLNYFFVNENFRRFVSKDYGDLYGSGHRRPFGMIWLMLVGACMPWILILPLFRRSITSVWARRKEYEWDIYVWSFALTVPIFYTFARQTSLYYVLPAMPWFALAVARLLDQNGFRCASKRSNRAFYICAGAGTAVLLVVTFIYGNISLGLVFGIVAILGLSLLNFYFLHQGHTDELYLTSAVFIVAVFSVGTLALSSVIDESLSSRKIVEYLEDDFDTNATYAMFLRKVPHSAYFYGREEAGDRMSFGKISKGDNIPIGTHYVIGSSNEVACVPASSMKDYSVQKQLGDWVLLTKNTN